MLGMLSPIGLINHMGSKFFPYGMTLEVLTVHHAQVGIDAFLVPLNTARTMETKLRENGHQLVALDSNPIDPIWTDR